MFEEEDFEVSLNSQEHSDLNRIVQTAVDKMNQNGWKVSQSKDGYCAYRGESNSCCLLGYAIPDEQYRSDFEGLDAQALIFELALKPNIFGSKLDTFSNDFARALVDFQQCHDFALGIAGPGDLIKEAVQEFIENYKLSITGI